MARAIPGVLRGVTLTLDAPVSPLDGKRAQVVIEPAETESDEARGLSSMENAALLRDWARHGPKGPIDQDDDFPDAP
jgi:hypothetical protein